MAKDFRLCLLFEVYKGILTDKQQEAFVNYYYDDLSLSEISENTGITRQGARDAIKRSEEILIDMEEKLGLSATLCALKEGLRQIETLCVSASGEAAKGHWNQVTEMLSEIKTISERLEEDGI